MENCEEKIMLEKLTFEIGGFFSGYKQIKIWVENGVAYKSIKMSFCDPGHESVEEIPKEQFERLEKKLAELSIGSWRKEYVDPGVLDGTQWELEYKEQGKRCRHICGSNDYPGSWKAFIEAIEDTWTDLLSDDI